MFQTLKAQHGVMGDLEYVVQSSFPASDKAKETKKQAACTRCKIKKLKCIIETNSCRKCLEASVTCSYRSTGRPESRRSSSGKSRMSRRDSSSISSGCISVYSEATPCGEPPQSGASYGDSGNTSSKGDSEMDTCLTAGHDDDPCSTFIDPAIATPSFITDLSAGTPSLTRDVDATRLSCSLDATLQGDELHEFDICFCADLIVAANATMQVKLVWATDSLNGCNTSSIDDMLQCQKNVLASCETFSACKKCSLKPDYMVLVISMCRQMVNGVKALEAITSPEMQSSGRPHPDTETATKAQLGEGGWRLDDDDEIEIIRHLIQVRIRKLRKLVCQLEHIVGANHASYTWVVGNIRRSLDGKLGPTTSHADDTTDLNG